MNGPIIVVDVSKGSCHYQGYLENGKPIRKPKVLEDTIEGFEKLNVLIEEIKKKLNCESVPILFEATGVYHRCLQKYLDDNLIPYYIISPLLSAAYRKTDLNGNKTDSLDCGHMAKAFYSEINLRLYKRPDDAFVRLQRLNRLYEDELGHLRKRKVQFRSYLDVIYPRLDKCFKGKSSLYDLVPLLLIKKYPHPKLLLKHKRETIINSLESSSIHEKIFIASIVDKMMECASHCYSGCDTNDMEVYQLSQVIDKLQKQIFICDKLLGDLVHLAKLTPYFDNVYSITGLGENLASRIIAEIGDISRFSNRKTISAYAGLNPKIRQSGDIDGTHLRISKKGNGHLRCLLYLGATCNYRLKKHDPLFEFNNKKRQQIHSPMKPKAANVATAHKLLIVIYALCKNNQEYNS